MTKTWGGTRLSLDRPTRAELTAELVAQFFYGVVEANKFLVETCHLLAAGLQIRFQSIQFATVKVAAFDVSPTIGSIAAAHT